MIITAKKKETRVSLIYHVVAGDTELAYFKPHVPFWDWAGDGRDLVQNSKLATRTQSAVHECWHKAKECAANTGIWPDEVHVVVDENSDNETILGRLTNQTAACL